MLSSSHQHTVDYLLGGSRQRDSKFMEYKPRPSSQADMGELQEVQETSAGRRSDERASPFRRSSESPVSKISRLDSPSSGSMESDHGVHVNTRKRRRGVIEKRRRDRINNSLAELRRLVPAAFEKQGSTKLEKAEILQLTVDYLKKGVNYASNIDAQTMGFQECAAEVGRFLTQEEGLSSQDPMRSRLMAHLQCYSVQSQTLKHSNSWHSSQYPTGPTGLIPPPPPPGMSTSSLFASPNDSLSGGFAAQIKSDSSMSMPYTMNSLSALQSPPCLGASAPTSSFSTPTFSQTSSPYSSFPAANSMQSMYMNAAAASSQASSYASSRAYRPWGGPEMVGAYC
ncbi:hypothetical protein RvY_13813 [Ramazzottius varieornatus]|uniref:BHLH domain-containing protein n=1 Tax=Ramazzottius varieornatus TaxID=947166 RepID=A0A1D1VWL8_RAMVA|nr:hypothetical protein RvY_13813 [Ramazzottius varieornatus]